MEWYYIDESKPEGNRRNGPWSLRQMLCFAEQGAFSSETLVWNETLSDWLPWGKCNERIVEEQKKEAEKKVTPQIVITQADSAGFLLRTCALLIDFAVLQLIFMLLTPLYGTLGVTQDISSKTPINDLMPLVLLSFILFFVYDSFFVKFFSGTPGKIVLGLAVIRQNGKQMSWGCAFLRAFVRFFSYSLFGIGCIIAAFDIEKRALHDYISNTKVMKLRNASVS